MKTFRNNSRNLLFGVLIIFAAGFNACNPDEKDVVVPKTLEDYKSTFAKMLDEEKNAVQTCVVGYNKGDFKSASTYSDITNAYMTVLLSAENTLTLPDLTIADIIDANKALTSPGKDFNDNRYISDRRPIHELIIYCDTLAAHTPAGTESGMAPAEARTVFVSAISVAKSVRSASTTIERQVAEAVEKLNKELEIFQAAIIP